MITEHDLQEAIAECEGQRNPTANTCIKLAAFYTIKQYMFPDNPAPIVIDRYSQSGAPEPTQSNIVNDTINYDSDSEFSRLVNGMNMQDFMEIIDDAMETLAVVNPRFYNSIMQKLSMV